ncbi:hypothetical protein PIB30_049810 [Stylosanthes scabra]|uniref:Uncharacterized protein n=1 Tax=Stylosanthes scabra TaxID=79078 RepID=A0ABU6UG58_9FABA|nr:hypothetical protein [Stylosanthes scabra]
MAINRAPASLSSPFCKMAITSTPELRLTHHLRLHEALFILYVSIPPLRFLLFQERSSLSKGHELPPMHMNEGVVHVGGSQGRVRWSNSKLEDALGEMGMEGCAWMLKGSGGIAYMSFELGI